MEYDKIIKIVIAVFFVGLLAAPVVMKNSNSDLFEDLLPEDRKQTALERYGFFLEDITEDAGITFTHQRPTLDARLDHIMPQVASMGASVSVADVNRDGWQDLYFTNSEIGSSNALYINNGDSTFTEMGGEMNVGDVNTSETGVSMGSVWGDYDNDGYEDLFIYKWGRSALYRNEDGKGFVDVSEQVGLPEWANINTAIWFDYNRDGHLDLFLGGYYHEEINLWDLATTEIMPESFEYALNGGRNYLFENQGDGTFKEVAEEVGVSSRRWALSAGAADINGDGYPDLVLANDYGVDELFINREGERFVEAGQDAGLGFSPKSGMNVAFADILNRGELSIYVTNISEQGILVQGNNLWVPNTRGGETTFSNLAGSFGIELSGWSYGGQFGDLNNDGFTDLYVANGYVSAEEGTDYWYDFSKVAGGNRSIISDATNWPAMEGRSLSGYQENKLFLNDGSGRFQDVTRSVGAGLNLDSRGVAFVDLWNRGALDIVVASQAGPAKLYRNQISPDRKWIAFALEGTESNKSAIGAEVELYWDDNRQVQVIGGGTSYSAQSQRPVYFGLGQSSTVEKAVIRWPSGQEQTITDPETNLIHQVVEDTERGEGEGEEVLSKSSDL